MSPSDVRLRFVSMPVIGVAVLFIAICLIFILCSTRKSRRRVRDEQFKENLGRYIGDVARQKKEAAGAVDLDDVPDHTLPMLENSNVPQTYETSDGNDASNEASDHVSLFTKKVGVSCLFIHLLLG